MAGQHAHSKPSPKEPGPAPARAPAGPSSILFGAQLVSGMQATVGNRAVNRLVQRSAEDDDAFTSQPVDDALTSQPVAVGDDNGQSVSSMSWSELQRAIREHETFLSEQTSTSPEFIERSARLDDLRERLAALSRSTRPSKRAKGRRGRSKEMPERPQSLSTSMSPADHSQDQMAHELDLIVDYLAANPPAAERRLLEEAVPFIRAAVEHDQAVVERDRRAQKVQRAMSPTSGSEADQFAEMLQRLQSMKEDPSQPGVFLLPDGDGNVVPLRADEAAALSAKVVNGLATAARRVDMFAGDVYLSWQERHDHNNDQPIVHGLVKFTSGASDIKRREMKEMARVSAKYIGMVKAKAQAGDFKEAGRLLLLQDSYVRYWAKQVGSWESALVGDAGRWVLALTVLKESLGILAGVGAIGLAAKGATLAETLAIGARVTGATTASGGLSAALGATATGEDVSQATRTGAAEGFGVGAQSLTAGAGKIASIGEVANATTRTGKAVAAGKAVAVDAGLGVTTSVTQAAIGGTDKSDAALGALVSSPIGTLGGGTVDALADGRTTKAVGSAIVGSTAAAAGAVATGGDVEHAAILGGAGGAYGSVASDPQAALRDDASPESSSTESAAPPEARAVSGVIDAGSSPSASSPVVGGEPSVVVDPAIASPEAPSRVDAGAEQVLDGPGEVYGPRERHEVIETDYGLPVENQTRFARAAEFLSMVIKIRPSNPASVRALRAGHLPKPAEIKAKTINEVDTHLGFRSEDIGLVGYRKPDPPKRSKTMDDATWAAVEARFEQRSAEFTQLSKSMDQLQRPVEQQEGTSGQRQYAVDGHGVVRVVDTSTGKANRAVTGDHDVFEFRDLISGRIITDPDRIAHAMNLIGDSSLAVMHPPHVNWKTGAGDADGGAASSKAQAGADMKNSIIQKHLSTEPLIVFRPGAPPTIEAAGIGQDY